MPKNQKSASTPAPEAPAEPVVEVKPVDSPAPAEVSRPSAESTVQMVKARVLVECEHGKCNDVVLIDAAQGDSLAGVVDADPAAVEYAESLA